MNPSTLYKALGAILGLGILIYATESVTESRHKGQIEVLQQEVAAARQAEKDALALRDEALKRAAVQADRADYQEEQASKQGKTVDALRAKLTALGTPKPASKVEDSPQDLAALQVAFASIGAPPTVQSAALSFPLPQARKVWALTKDGSQYPALLEQYGALQEVHSAQTTQLRLTQDALSERSGEAKNLHVALDHSMEALVAADQQSRAQTQISTDWKKVAGEEHRKGLLKALGAFALGALIDRVAHH